MAITTYPLNGIDYDARDAAGYTATRTSGVYSSEEDFAVTAAGGLSVTVSAGVGWIHPARFEGYSVILREAETLTLALADGQRPRIDRIVLRYDAAARKSSLLVLQGTPDTQPTAPDISRTALLYDLCLAQITRPAGSTTIVAGNITDTRLDPALCGVMRDGVTGIPTEELLASAREHINALEETASAAAKEANASKTAAAQSEANAKAYKEAAATSESNAAASASASAGSAAAAARSESAAAGSATKASGSASAAEKSKTAAATSEANAAKHEEAAKKAADEAGAKAGTDPTLSIENAPADAKKVGDELAVRYTKEEVDGKLAGKLDLAGGTMTGPLILMGGGTAFGFLNNAATHNGLYRGKYLGDHVTDAQYAAIKAGTFEDLYLGDYWTINGVDYIIAAFDYWLYTGSNHRCGSHHIGVVPRNVLYNYAMNTTNTTSGGYANSNFRKNGLTRAKEIFNSAFGVKHILTHDAILSNAVTNGKISGSDIYDSTVDLMSEIMIYGTRQFTPMPIGVDPWDNCRNYTYDNSQIPLFRLAPWDMISNTDYWLRDAISDGNFSFYSSAGNSSCISASTSIGIRPICGIC